MSDPIAELHRGLREDVIAGAREALAMSDPTQPGGAPTEQLASPSIGARGPRSRRGWPLPQAVVLWAACLLAGIAAGDLFLSGERAGPSVVEPEQSTTTTSPASTTTLGPVVTSGGVGPEPDSPTPSTSTSPVPDEPDRTTSTTVGPATTVEPPSTSSSTTTTSTTEPIEDENEDPDPEPDGDEKPGLPRAQGVGL